MGGLLSSGYNSTVPRWSSAGSPASLLDSPLLFFTVFSRRLRV